MAQPITPVRIGIEQREVTPEHALVSALLTNADQSVDVVVSGKPGAPIEVYEKLVLALPDLLHAIEDLLNANTQIDLSVCTRRAFQGVACDCPRCAERRARILIHDLDKLTRGTLVEHATAEASHVACREWGVR